MELSLSSSLFRHDRRTVEEKLLVLASIGCESPEALTLVEIKALCQAVVHRLPTAPGRPLRPGTTLRPKD